MDNKDFQNNIEPEEQEIDLMELAQKLWAEKRMILKWCGIPDLYPDVVKSVPFSVGLFDTKVQEAEGDSTITVSDYLENYTSAPWWGVIMGLPGQIIGGVKSLFVDDEEEGDGKLNPFRLTKEESDMVKALGDRIAVNVDSKSYVITISVTMQDPLVSAMLADSVATRLKDYVTDYRTNKARSDMDYARQINEEARDDYYNAQQKYAEYVDKNHGISLNARKTEEERLRNEAQLAFNLYNSTAQQLQAARAKVQENTPVYAIIEPATVPVKASKPRKVMILAGFIFLAFVAASAWILFGRGFKESFKAGVETEK